MLLFLLCALQDSSLPVKLSSKHYEIRASVTRGQAQELLDFMEEIHPTYSTIFRPGEEAERRRLPLHLHKNRDEYLKAGGPGGSGAFHDGKKISGYWDPDLMKACFAHEAVHHFVRITSRIVSAIRMARAGARVRTIEIDDSHAEFAEEWISKSDVADRIRVFRGPAQDVLPRFTNDSTDAAFLDADKAGYPGYLRECVRIVRPGGLIMVGNAFAFGQLFDAHPTDREVGAVRTFNEVMAGTRELQSVIVPIGDGLLVGVKR